jgi:hypothetical protein
MQRFWLIILALMLAADPARFVAAQEAGRAAVRLNPPSALTYPSAVLPGGDKLFGLSGSSVLPGWLRWALAPRLESGDSFLNPGLASAQELAAGYRGLSWSVPLASGLLHQDDALSFGFSLGRGLGDLVPGAEGQDRGPLRPTPYVRMGAGLGYQVTPRLGLYVLFDHISGGGPLHVDETQNNLGMRVGLRF